MASRPLLSAPRPDAPTTWPYHTAKVASLPAHLLMRGDRRLEGDVYLTSGYGIRLALETQPDGWVPLSQLARVWQPGRLKGIQVGPKYGTPFLAATQVFDLRPVPRKFLSLERTNDSTNRFLQAGTIVVTCSGSVGKATMAFNMHEPLLISHDLLRVVPHTVQQWGWVYAYLRSPQARAMMSSAQYGHVIKHLEVAHLNALPVPQVSSKLAARFAQQTQEILDARNKAHTLFAQAEKLFEEAIGPVVQGATGEKGFTVRSRALSSGRRRMEATFNNPAVVALWAHFAQRGFTTTSLSSAGFNIWLPTRFRRIPATQGVTLVGSANLFEINPDLPKVIADGDFGDRNRGRVEPGWLLLARSGQIYGINGQLQIAHAAYKDKIISDHVIRIAPRENATLRTGYVYTALSHPILGRPLVKALAYGSSIPEIEVADVENLAVVRIGDQLENTIADLAEQAAALLASADILENHLAAEAEALLDRFIAGERLDKS